jgi:predicted TIM-barrel fold metal-dependent hydrolase
LFLWIAFKYMGDGYRRWADILSMREVDEIAREMLTTFDKDGIQLFVPLVIDYEYWFKNTVEPSPAEQIDMIYRKIVLPFKGRIHPFIQFCPARELAHRHGIPGPDGGAPEPYSSLALVKDAISNKGFIGVKLYNALGYRPLENDKVNEERNRIFSKNHREQYTQFKGEEFDDVLRELYKYCVENQVPITTHCSYTGVEAYPGASHVFGRPDFWIPALKEFPDLHVDLAHFGWSQPDAYQPARRNIFIRALQRIQQAVTRQPDRRGEKTWVEIICEMMSDHRYLFADVAHNAVMVDKDIPKFKESYRAICRDFPGVLQKKLLFGIDWHVIVRVDHYEEFKDRFEKVLLDPQIFTPQDMTQFLGGNALEFLGLLPLGSATTTGWTGNRERLDAFYRRNGITPPDWFQQGRP